MLLMGFVFVPNSSAETQCETNVHVEQNGEVTEFHNTDCEGVNYESDDGSIRVNVNTNTGNNSIIVQEENTEEAFEPSDAPNVTATSTITPTISPTESEEETVEGDVQGASDTSEPLVHDDVFMSTSLSNSDIFMTVATAFPSPFSQVHKLFSLLQSAVYLL